MKDLLLIILLSLSFIGYGQTTLSGVVVDDLGTPLASAHVFNTKKSSHSYTNESGEFILPNTKVGDSIVVEYIGFFPYKFKVNSLSEKKIKLRSATFNLSSIYIQQSIDALQWNKNVDLTTSPVTNAQSLLVQMPGLFIGQHAGGGKAEQIFFRGFDIDHGTDLAISVDGMPVNMVSHAHGQGYADLHFVIPELIQKVEYEKGPHETTAGNFSTAGFVNLKTLDKLKSSEISVERGMFNNNRILGLFDLIPRQNQQSAYLAISHQTNDGPFESAQNFYRTNAAAKYINYFNGKQKLTISGSYFNSKWNASGQIPMRAVNSGMISRFGAIDNTEGGSTSRGNLQIQLNKMLGKHTYFKSMVYYSQYQFQLFSNFTFFLQDSVNGDQIKQRETRSLYGMTSSISNHKDFGETRLTSTLGIGFRQDQSFDNQLSKTINRVYTDYYIQNGDVLETNSNAYAQIKVNRGGWQLEQSLRLDHFDFQYVDQLSEISTKIKDNAIVLSPKIQASYKFRDFQFFAKSGKGFHSNDARVVLFNKAKNALPTAWGNDVGAVYQQKRWMANLTLWHLDLQQEFVYVGDAGIVEPSGATRRYGIDIGTQLQANKFIVVKADFTHAHARDLNEVNGNNYIPLAPRNAGTFSIECVRYKNWDGALRGRFLGDRSATTDQSIIAKGYVVIDANLSRSFGKTTIGMVVNNLLNTNWIETQFATESRLKGEEKPVEEIHFTPGTPFYFQLKIKRDLF